MKKLPNIQTDFAEWYQAVVYAARLVDQAPVRGCYVLMPYGNALWENIKFILNKKISECGVENIVLPLLIPTSFIAKEKSHIAGFAPELAVVTHAGGKKLEEALVIRPTSETMVHYMFSKWIKSYKDLPLRINQWVNVLRWEKRPRAFLRTSEFFWQEGHTAHATREEALAEALKMHALYIDFVENYLALPVIAGKKTESEKFSGADTTFTLEVFLQDGKAVQIGTSHLLTQNFSKTFEIKFQTITNSFDFPYLTSWGMTTRLIGVCVGAHGDSNGLVLPPKIAPIQIIIVPIFKASNQDEILKFTEKIQQLLCELNFRVQVDCDKEKRLSEKFSNYELQGIPLRIEFGEKEIREYSVLIFNRQNKTKQQVCFSNLQTYIANELNFIQQQLFEKVSNFYKSITLNSEKLSIFAPILELKSHLVQTGWCGTASCEAALKNYSASIRCILETGIFKSCFNCEKVSIGDVVIAKSY